MNACGRVLQFTAITLTGLIGSLFLPQTSIAGPIIVAQTENGSIVATFDFATGNQIASFVTDAGTNARGRAVEVVGNTVYYATAFSTPGDIHLAPYNSGLGGSDFATFSNPRPGFGVQDLDYRNGVLYALTGYPSGLPIVFSLSPTDGHVISSVSIQSHPGTGSDGFTVLPNGDFLINDDDNEPTYRGYDPTTGNPTGLVITLSGLGRSTGVDYNPGDNSLYFHNLSPFGLTRTTLTGTFIESVPIPSSLGLFGDISVLAVPEPSSLALVAIGLAGLGFACRKQ